MQFIILKSLMLCNVADTIHHCCFLLRNLSILFNKKKTCVLLLFHIHLMCVRVVIIKYLYVYIHFVCYYVTPLINHVVMKRKKMPTNEKLRDVYPCQLMTWFEAQYNSNDITKHPQPMWGRKDEILLPHVLWLFIAIHFFPKDGNMHCACYYINRN